VAERYSASENSLRKDWEAGADSAGSHRGIDTKGLSASSEEINWLMVREASYPGIVGYNSKEGLWDFFLFR